MLSRALSEESAMNADPLRSVAKLPCLKGKLLMRNDSDYEAARLSRLFCTNHPERYPVAVLKAECEQDVIDGVRLAKVNGWKVAVRAGGHSFASWSLREDSLLIDLGAFKDISYDERTGIVSVTASVQGGGDLSPYLSRVGRFFPGGHCTDAGLGGFLLQGGMGWNARGWGWAAEWIVAIDVVTANGELVRADETQHSDLFWAARGAGPGFFGVVTRFHLRTVPAPKALTQSTHIYPIELFDPVMSWLLDVHAGISTDVEVKAYAMTQADGMPGAGGRVLVVVGLALVDTVEQAEAALAPLATCPLIGETIVRSDAAPTSFEERYKVLTAANPHGYRWLSDNAWLEGPNGEVVRAMRNLFVDLPTDRSIAMFFSLAPLRSLPDMALSLQTEVYCASYVVYKSAKQDAPLRLWLSERMREMEPFTVGQFLGDSDQSSRQVQFMGEAPWLRLQQIRAEYDPGSMFVGYLAKSSETLNTNEWQAA
jgi:FAD/FMN-containing dehydrogenase